jgi:hypothetical protein
VQRDPIPGVPHDAGEWVSPAAAEGFFHTFSGWLMFVVAFAGLLIVQRVVSSVGVRRQRPALAGAA